MLQTMFIDFLHVLPPNSVIKSVIAKFKIKKFGTVLIYEFARIVIHVKMFPGTPNIDTTL